MSTKVLFIGPSPSKKNTDPNIPFQGTKSHITLKKWIKQLGLKENQCEFLNVTKVINAKKFTDDEQIRLICRVYSAQKNRIRAVVLGKQVTKCINKFRIGKDCFSLPHPSGRNRQLNDKLFITNELNQCKRWLNK